MPKLTKSNAFSPDATSELNVLGHNGDALGVDGAQIGVFEQTYHVCFGSFLQRKNGLGLESEVGLVFLGDFTNETLEGQFSNEQFGGLLELADLTEGNCACSEAVGLFDALVGDICGFAGGFVRELLARGFRAGVLAGGLFGAGHFRFSVSAAELLLKQAEYSNRL